jgi:hypothetical protein
MAVKSEPIKVKAVQCTKCAGPIEIRAPHLISSVACPSCGTVLDAKDPNLAILHEHQRRMVHKPLIPLGAKGKLKGEMFLCIGFLRRRTTVEGVNYDWSEYLLYNPFKGFRWLVEYQGHWVSSKLAHVTPKPLGFEGGAESYEFLGSTYKHFQSVSAKVVFVAGEFYWQVQVGETALCSDYVCPPHILSKERVEKEETWSIGDYVDGKDVWEAFRLEGDAPEPVGVAAAQPSPLGDEMEKVLPLVWAFVIAACVLQILFGVISQNKQAFTQSFDYQQKSSVSQPQPTDPSTGSTTPTTSGSGEIEKWKITDYFELTGRSCNLVVKTQADVDNHYLYNHYVLINEKTEKALDFGREVGYYRGSDSDGPWSEGSKVDEVTVPNVPAGKYYMLIEPQSDQQRVEYSVTVRRDVVELWPLMLALLFLVIPPAMLKYRQWSFEVERWKESDHPLIASGESSDDD